ARARVAWVSPGPDRLRAVGAADRRVAAVVQRVVRNAVLADVVPDVALRPVGQRVQLPQPEALVPGELRGALAVARVTAADAGNPAVDRGESLAHRLDLAQAAAGVRLALPQLVPVLLGLFGNRQVVVAMEVDAEVL